jgi:hypothetical protein
MRTTELLLCVDCGQIIKLGSEVNMCSKCYGPMHLDCGIENEYGELLCDECKKITERRQ